MELLQKINSPDDLKKLSINELYVLSGEIRKKIIDTISKNGGHLAPNLGTVELTIALHYVFDFKKDKLIFDVGHQSYTHKIITGRREKFETIRKKGGISGYLNPEESFYDEFIVGHSSTALSIASGFVVKREKEKEDYKIVAVVGDGSLTAGIGFEGLNNIAQFKKQTIVILNDNGMSISKNVGAISSVFNKLRSNKLYQKLRSGVLSNKVFKKLRLSLKGLLFPTVFFEEFGFDYFGVVDGHNIKDLIDILNRVKNINGPVLLHIETIKGKGYDLAEKDPTKFHGPAPFLVENGEFKVKEETYSDVFSNKILEIAETDSAVIAITAAMRDGTGLKGFSLKFPDRFFDVGIAEQHAIAFAASLAKQGFKPFVAIYSTFLQRAYDQIIHDVSIMNLPVRFIIDRAGIVSDDGPTHQGVFDIAYLNAVPNLAVMSPKDKEEFLNMLDFMKNYERGPVALRFSKNPVFNFLMEGYKTQPIETGKAEIIKEGEKISILSFGTIFDIAFDVFNELKKNGFTPSLINLRFAKPIDKEAILKIAKTSEIILTIEDGTISSGIYSNVLKILNEANCFKKVISVGINDIFPKQGKRKELLQEYGFSKEEITEKILNNFKLKSSI